jgi:hypothetical protein
MSEDSHSSSSSSEGKDNSVDLDLDDLDINDFIENVDVEYFIKNPPPDYYEVCPPTYKESSYYPSISFQIMSLHDNNENNQEEKKVRENENLKKMNRKNMKKKKNEDEDKDKDILDETENYDLNTTLADRNEKKLQEILDEKDEFIDQTETFIGEVYDFYNRLSKINLLIENAKDKIIKYTKKENTDEKGKKKKAPKPKKGEKIVNEEEEFEKVGLFIENVLLHKVEEFNSCPPYSFDDLCSLKSELSVDLLNTKDIMVKYFNFKKK